MENFTSRQVCKLLDISYRQLNYWESKKLVTPSINKPKGSGESRLYSVSDIRRLKVIKEFRDMGFNLKKIRMCLNTLRDFFPGLKYTILEGQIFSQEKSIFIMSKNPDINVDFLIDGGSLVLYVPLKSWMEELKKIIDNFTDEIIDEEREQAGFYNWAETLAESKGLNPMTPEEIWEVSRRRESEHE